MKKFVQDVQMICSINILREKNIYILNKVPNKRSTNNIRKNKPITKVLKKKLVQKKYT